MNEKVQKATEYFLRQNFMEQSIFGPFNMNRRIDVNDRQDRTQVQLVSGRPPEAKLYIRNTTWRKPALAIAGYRTPEQQTPELFVLALLQKQDHTCTFVQGVMPITLIAGRRIAILFSTKPLSPQDVFTTPEGETLLEYSVRNLPIQNTAALRILLGSIQTQGYTPSQKVREIIMGTKTP